MPIPSKDINRMTAAIEEAESAFWADIVTSYPEAKHGDFSPEATLALSDALFTAVTLWLEWNADPQESDTKIANIMLHRIEYNYNDDELTLTDADEEHIAYCISNGTSEGELSTTVAVTTEKCIQSVRGYWKINNNPDA